MVSHVPAWVFVLLGVLVFFGIRQSRARLVAPGTLATVALLMLGLSLYGVVAAFGVHAAPLAAWALGVVSSASLGRWIVDARRLERVSSSVRVPGSWLPLAVMLGIFTVKFVLGFASAVHHPVVSAPGFVVGASFTFGLFSGVFAARALVVRAFARGGRAGRSARHTGRV